MTRVAVAEIKQEANTFSPVPTTLDTFRSEHLLEGPDILEALAGTNTEVRGFTERARAAGAEVIPLIAASAVSGGPWSADCYDHLRSRLAALLRAAQPLDGLFLALHGAMVADVPGGEDASGLLLAEARRIVGDQIPLLVTLDLHAVVTRAMMQHATAIIGYRTWPHVDQTERGQEAAEMLLAAQRGSINPVCALSKLRMVLQVENGQTDAEPMVGLLAQARAWEASGKCLSASVFLVHPPLDLPEHGCAITVIADGERQQAQRLADELGRQMWERRHAFDVTLSSVDEALDRAVRAVGRPVILADAADSTGSGTPGDSTEILRRIVERGLACRALVTMVDPDAVRIAEEAGVGASVRLRLGGKRDPLFGRPLDLQATVEWLGAPSFVFGGPVYTGVQVHMGPVAVLQVLDTHILVSGQALWTIDPALYRAVGLEPAEAQIVVVKSPATFRAAYGPIAHEMIVVDAPGLSTPNLRRLPYTRLPRPFYPFDEDWPGAPWAPNS
jgi:microcystin degradation protein MlrC